MHLYLAVIDVAMSVAVVVAVWFVIAARASRQFRLGAGIFLGLWLVAALAAAPAPDSVLQPSRFPISPVLPIFAAVPATIVLIAYALSPAVRQAFASASLPALHGVQVYRVEGVQFLILLASGQVPAYFAARAGWFDIIVGVAALPLAFMLARRVPGSRALAFAWNIFGLIDLLLAVGTGTGFLVHQPPVAVLGVFPVVLIPTLGVPIAIILHVISLARLSSRQRVQ